MRIKIDTMAYWAEKLLVLLALLAIAVLVVKAQEPERVGGQELSLCLLRPEAILAGPEEVPPVRVSLRLEGERWPRSVEARGMLRELTDPRDLAAVAIQYNLARRNPDGVLGYVLIQAWVDEPGVPRWTLQRLVNTWAWSGSSSQRRLAGELLPRVLASATNESCNRRW